MKKQILIIGFIFVLLVSVVFAAVTNTDITNFVTKFAGKVGVGVEQPREALDVNGSIVIGSSVNETPGTLRYQSDKFEGRLSSGWVDLNLNTGKTADGIYLYNDSTTVYFNSSKLNATINAKNTEKSADGIYLYNDSTTVYFNSTYANSNLNVNSSNYWDSLDTPLDITTLQTVTVNNNLTVTNDLIVTGESYVTNITASEIITGANMLITNDATITNDLNVNNDLYVSNNASITNDLTVTGEIFVDNITDSNGHIITTNSTCKIIQGATSTLSIC